MTLSQRKSLRAVCIHRQLDKQPQVRGLWMWIANEYEKENNLKKKERRRQGKSNRLTDKR